MNWEKEGYKVGQEVFIVRKGMFTRDISYHTGTISHIGIKKLVVYIDSKMQLTFTDDRECAGAWGDLYTFYNNKEEYEEELAKKKAKNDLIAEIRDNLNKLSMDKLNAILDIIKEDNDG